MADFAGRPAVLIVFCALAYAGATVAMKAASHTAGPGVMLLIVLCLCGAVVAEVLLMRRMDLSLTYIAILATETTLVLLVALWLGEALSLRQILGAGLVLAGAVLVTA